jgi:hypothetical protein
MPATATNLQKTLKNGTLLIEMNSTGETVTRVGQQAGNFNKDVNYVSFVPNKRNLSRGGEQSSGEQPISGEYNHAVDLRLSH